MIRLAGKMKKPERNKKKIAIIVAVIVVVCLSASGGLYLVFRDKGPPEDEFGRRPPRFHDANLPDVRKQSAQEILDYRNSDKFKKLSQREQMMYTMMSGRQVMDHQIETFFTIPKEDKNAYLDKMIDEMQKQRENMEKMRSDANQMPRRPRDANDPNVAKRMQERMAQRNNPSNSRARSERGTALQRAQRSAFMNAMRQRMQERGISMPSPGGGGRGGGGGGGGPGGGGPGGP